MNEIGLEAVNDSHTRRLIDALESIALRHARQSDRALFEAMQSPPIIDAEQRDCGQAIREALDFVGKKQTSRWLDAFWEAHTAARDARSVGMNVADMNL